MQMIEDSHFDVSIIGGGVIGCAIARELSKYRITVAVFEQAPDVGWSTSSRNSGVVHAGFNNQPGSLMARLCVEGNQTFEAFCRPLDVPYEKQGKLVVARQKKDIATLERLQEQGRANGAQNLSILDDHDMHLLEPDVQGIAALYSPETAITSPYLLTIALAENALQNGTQFFLQTTVEKITRRKTASSFTLKTNQGTFTSDYIINSAGLYADKVAAMLGIRGYRIYPCRGEYHILDKRTSSLISRPVYPAPVKGEGGLGVHFTTTIGGVLLIGPSAEYIPRRNDVATTRRVMKQLFEEAQSFLPHVSLQNIIRSYSGLRAKQAPPSEGGFRDYIIEESRTVPNAINLIGIESPGLTAAEPIAKMVTALIDAKEKLESTSDFVPNRPGILKFDAQDEATKRRLIQHDSDYGEIICRCEHITKKEVLDALHNPLDARTLHSIKYRTRAMMGRCQGGYCLPRLVELLLQEGGMALKDIQLGEKDSTLLTGYRS